MERIVTTRSLFSAAASALCVISKIAAVGITMVIVLIDYFSLGLIGAIITTVAVAVPCLWASVVVSRMAYDAETNPDNYGH